MIYLTVGSYQRGFDRLVKKIDEICGKYNIDCIAQIGTTSYKPQNLKFKDFFVQEEHLNHIKSSVFVVTHGGFGIIGDIMRLSKPMVIVPRAENEGPNDQIEMAKRVSEMYDIPLCLNIDNLEEKVLFLLNSDNTINYRLDNNIATIISDFLINN